MINKINQTIEEHFSEMVEIRRYLHQHPELSFKEYKTAAFIANYYERLGIPYRKNVGGNGVIATLTGGLPGKTIAFRADFDALPIHDEKDVPYRSQVDGVMHACGHDGHTAILLTLAKVLQKFQDQLPGNVVFLHQHAEERTPGGARSMIDDGALDNVDAIFGAHLWATEELGVLQTSRNVLMAGADRFEITIQGKGGHGAVPHQTKDAVVIGAEIVLSLQKIISRQLDPLATAVLTIGKFDAGNDFNIIADQARLIGTVRYLQQDVQTQMMNDMERIINGICLSHGCSYEMDYEKGYPPLINHETEAEVVRQAASKIEDLKMVEEIQPMMSSEDFSYYLLEKPGAYFFIGAKKAGHDYPHHHPKFDFDERVMPMIAKTFAQTYLDYQKM